MTKADLNCLKEMRNACAACFRVIAKHNLIDELEFELPRNVKKGFGVRFQNLIKRMDKK